MKYDLYFRTGNGEFGFYKNINYEEIITSFTFPELSEIEEIKIFNKTESKLIHEMVQCMSFPLFDRQCYGSLLDNFG